MVQLTSRRNLAAIVVGSLFVCTACGSAGDAGAPPFPDGATGVGSGQGGLAGLCFDHVELEGPNAGNEQTASLIVDVDGDGTDDFVIAERTAAPSVVWYRREGTSWTRYVVDDSQLRVEAGGSFTDIDGDGDQDISFAADSRSNEVWWWENPAPSFDPSVPWIRRSIKSSGANKHHDQLFGDFDADGADELVFWNQRASALFLAEIPDDPHSTEPWALMEIYSHGGSVQEGLAQADVNADGQIDIVAGGRWFEHTGGDSFVAHVVDEAQSGRAAAGQLKPGGWAEIVFSHGDDTGPIAWYEWTEDGWERNELLGHDVERGHSLQVVDANGDGHQDIFSAEMRRDGDNPDAAMWLFLGDGEGSFEEVQLASGYGNHESRMGDLDGDGRQDILGKPYNWETPRIDVWLSCTGEKISLDRWRRHVVDDARPSRAVFVLPGDFDGDSLPDIAAGAWWYRNPGPLDGSWERTPFGNPLRNVAALHDFDMDGDLDALGTEGDGSDASSTFAWADNDGSGAFSIQSNIEDADGDFLQGVCVGDLVAGAGADVALSWHRDGVGVQVLSPPSDPGAGTWTVGTISETSQDEQISCDDIDADGDVDVLLGTMWLENQGDAFALRILSDAGGDPDRSRLFDINNDGRLDAVVGYEAISKAGKLAWHEQPAIASDLWIEHVISVDVFGPMSLDVGDLDEDGDLDVVVGEHNLTSPETARLLVFENVDGAGISWQEHFVSQGDEHHDGAQLVDIDNDGDLDIVSIGWGHARVLLYENLAR